MANDTTRPTDETITSLQRELAEAREHAKEVRLALTSIRAAVDADLGLERASNEAPVEVNTELYRTKILEAIAALKSRASLTPLTDPSVRGVLVDDGEPRKLEPGEIGWNIMELYSHPHGESVGPSLFKYQPLKVVPASEVGVARGEPGLKKLEPGMVLLRPAKDGESPDGDVTFGCMVYKQLDPALYAIPDGGERITDDTALHAAQCEAVGWQAEAERRGERIKELEAELADWKADTADQLCVNCSDPLEYQERADAAVRSDAERLRKAIETHQRTLNPTGDGAVNEVHNKLWSALSPSPAAASDPAGERIKELEAERQLSPSVEGALSAINRALLFFRQGDQSSCDGMNEREISLAATAGIKSVRNAFGTEQSMHSAWRKRATEAESDAERLRKAIERGHHYACVDRNATEQDMASALAVVRMELATALSPSTAAASGEWLNKMADAEDAAGDISIGTSAPAAESDKPYGLVEQMDAGEGTVYGRRVTVKRREEPAAETQGNARHHSEGAKIPEGGSGSSAAESEGSERTEVERLEQCIEVYERSCTQWAEQCNGLIAERDEARARLAACEERCRELEAGIKEHKEETIRALTTTGNRVPWQGDLGLWSLLAPKAGGEDAV